MKRVIAGVIVGYAVWTVLWLGGNMVLFGSMADVVGAGEFYGAAGPLLGVIVLSIVCSVAAGLAVTSITRRASRRALLVLGGLLLITGIGVQASVWSLMPAWYHLTFLALLVPIVVSSGSARSSTRRHSA